jgi:hypothetical protein
LNDLPKTKAEAVEELLSSLTNGQIEEIAAMKKEDLICMHHGLGTHIRNSMGLWQKNDDLLNDCCKGEEELHPDTASMKIIEAAWEELKSQGF